MAELTTKRKVMYALIPSAVVCALGFVAVEVYIRQTSAYGYVTPETLRSMTPDYQPAVFARQVIRQTPHRIVVNGEEQYRINAHGYRGREFSASKPEGKIRIMFYGGSSVFDADSPGDNDWPHRVERMLRSDGFTNVEVINAGVPGYSAAEAVGTLFAEGHLFAPDYVLLYDQWNDIKYFRSPKSLLREFVREDLGPDPRITYQNGVDRILSRTSQLYVRLRARYYTWKLQIGSEGARQGGDWGSEISETALRQYRLNMETFADIARNIGAVPILMLEARLVERDNTAQEKERISYDYVLLTHDALCTAFERQDKIIYDVGRQKNLHVIDATQQLSGRGEFFETSVHVNPTGSERLARLVADDLAKILRADVQK
jgi:hypothetical protein